MKYLWASIATLLLAGVAAGQSNARFITGTVVNANGAGVPKVLVALVELTPGGVNTKTTAFTDDDGQFNLGQFPSPRDPCEVCVADKTGLVSTRMLAGWSDNAILSLPEAAYVKLTVTNSSGQPLGNAAIGIDNGGFVEDAIAYDWSVNKALDHYIVITNAKGEVIIRASAGSRLYAEPEDARFQPATVGGVSDSVSFDDILVFPSASQIVTRSMKVVPSSTLTGRIIDSATGNPVSNATVVFMPCQNESSPQPLRVSTDANGNYVVSKPMSCEYLLAGISRESASHVITKYVPVEGQENFFVQAGGRMVKDYKVRGTVQIAQAGARTPITGEGNSKLHRGAGARYRANGVGHVETAENLHPSGQSKVEPVRKTTTAVPPSSTRAPVAIKTVPAPTNKNTPPLKAKSLIAAHVPAAAPVNGKPTPVAVPVKKPTNPIDDSYGTRFPGAGHRGIAKSAPTKVVRKSTNNQQPKLGQRTVVAGAETHRVLSATGSVSHEKTLLSSSSAGAKAVQAPIEVKLVTGSVKGANGVSVPNAMVALVERTPTGVETKATALTDANGKFNLGGWPSEPGNCELCVFDRAGDVSQTELFGNPEGLVLQMPQPSFVLLSVTDPSNWPLAESILDIHSATGQEVVGFDWKRKQALTHFSVKTDSMGQVLIGANAGSQFRIEPRDSRYQPAAIHGPNRLDTALHLPASGGTTNSTIRLVLSDVFGVVTDSKTGAPVPGALLIFLDDQLSNSYVFAVTDASGRYSLSGLTTGSYTLLSISPQDLTPKNSEVNADAAPSDPILGNMTFQLNAGGHLIENYAVGESERKAENPTNAAKPQIKRPAK